MKINFTLIILFVFFVVSCNKKDKSSQAPPPQNIKVYQISTETVPIYKDFVGQVYGEKDIPIRARVDGYLENVHFKEGSLIKKGQILYTIDSKPFQEAVVAQQSMVSQAETILAQAQNDLKMLKPLAEMNAISKREMDIAQSKKDAAASSLKAAKAGLKLAEIDLGYSKIYAPIDGIIGKTLAREGEYVGRAPNPVILNTISKIKSIRVQFFLSEAEYLRFMDKVLHTDRLKELKKQNNLELILTDGTVHKYKGHIDFIDRNIDPTTGTILMQASFPNPDRLIRPGQFTHVRAMVGRKEDAILIPQQTVREVQGQNFVYVVDESDMIENRHINILTTYKDFFIVKDGLKSGERIVLENIQKLRSKMSVIPEVSQYQSKVDNNINN